MCLVIYEKCEFKITSFLSDTSLFVLPETTTTQSCSCYCNDIIPQTNLTAAELQVKIHVKLYMTTVHIQLTLSFMNIHARLHPLKILI